MWTRENRRRYDRSGLRYETDLTDDEWAEIAPLIPPAKPGGNKRSVNLREVVNGMMYILGTGCQWRAIPKDLAARSTVYDYFDRWSWDGTLERIHHALYVKCREQAAREASPTAAIIDAQSVKSAEKGGAHIDPHGYDAGKKVKGKKRHVLVDTQGMVLNTIVTAADVQDRDGERGCSAHYSVSTLSCSSCLPMAAIRDRSSAPPSKPCCQRCRWRSSSVRIGSSDLSCCPDVGSWRERLLG